MMPQTAKEGFCERSGSVKPAAGLLPLVPGSFLQLDTSEAQVRVVCWPPAAGEDVSPDSTTLNLALKPKLPAPRLGRT